MENERSMLIAPHNDDEVLWASTIALRASPLIVVVTDSWVQYNRGQVEITAERRRSESEESARILGCRIEFLGIRDDEIEETRPMDILEPLMERVIGYKIKKVYAPAWQGGHPHHDLVSKVAKELFRVKVRVLYYSTYARGQNKTPHGLPLAITEAERETKFKALRCHVSQSWQGHFTKVMMDPEEYIS